MVAQTLGFLDEAPGLAWAARMAGRGELDAPRLWRSVRRAAPGGPRVLVGLPRAELWTEIRPGTWDALLELFRVAFPVTVVDAGFCLEEDEELLYDQVRLRRNAVTRLAVQAADLVIAVARADPVGLHAFIRGYQELRDLGVPASRVRVVVNQLRPGMFGGDRPAEQVRAALSRYVGIEPAAVIPYDRPGVDAALLAGQALREARPGCPAQIALARLAALLFPAQAAPPRRRRGRAPASVTAATGAGS
jgi:Flp pilus assembly CpaE family ATPase